MFPENSINASDITVSIGGKEIGKIKGINFSADKAPIETIGSMNMGSGTLGEKSPIFSMGSADPRSFPSMMLNVAFEDVVLLSSEGISYEELHHLIPGYGEEFDIDRLIKWNPGVFPRGKAKASVISSGITEKGIVGTLVIKEMW